MAAAEEVCKGIMSGISRKFCVSICPSKAVTQEYFRESFSKFGSLRSKFMKKNWALRARNSRLGQPPAPPALSVSFMDARTRYSRAAFEAEVGGANGSSGYPEGGADFPAHLPGGRGWRRLMRM